MDVELGKLSSIRELQVLHILNNQSPLGFDDIDLRRIKSGSLTVILDDLVYYGLAQVANYIDLPIDSVAHITQKGRDFLSSQDDNLDLGLQTIMGGKQ